jgi:hypothetical protein
MKKYLFLLPLAFVGCTFTQTSKKVTSFTKCYVHQLPAPFWICYQSSFMSVGKVHTQEISRLKQEEAYAKGVNNLVEKLIIQTKKFLERVEIKKDITDDIKTFIILNALETHTWYSKKSNMLYVKVEVDKESFKKFLFSKLNLKKEQFEEAFDETF